jgi:hypothetical protein
LLFELEVIAGIRQVTIRAIKARVGIALFKGKGSVSIGTIFRAILLPVAMAQVLAVEDRADVIMLE